MISNYSSNFRNYYNINLPLIDFIYLRELHNFRVKQIKTISSSSMKIEPLVNGNILYKTKIKRSSIQELVSNGINTTNNDIKLFSIDILFKNVSNKIIKINKGMSFEQALEFILNIRSKAKKHFYGAVMKNKNTGDLINPFHILTCMFILNDYDKYKNDQWEVYTFVYNNFNKVANYTNDYLIDIDKIEKDIDKLIATIGNRITNISYDVQNIELKNTEVSVKYKINKTKDEDEDNDYYIIPNQVCTKGLVIPFYGTSIVKINGEVGGSHLSPFLSANIQVNYINGSFTNLTINNSVCTGQLSNKTLEGLRTLNHSNLSSPYNTMILAPGFIEYATIMINKCIYYYNKAGLISSDIYNDSIIDIEQMKKEKEPELNIKEILKELNKLDLLKYTFEDYYSVVNLSPYDLQTRKEFITNVVDIRNVYYKKIVEKLNIENINNEIILHPFHLKQSILTIESIKANTSYMSIEDLLNKSLNTINLNTDSDYIVFVKYKFNDTTEYITSEDYIGYLKIKLSSGIVKFYNKDNKLEFIDLYKINKTNELEFLPKKLESEKFNIEYTPLK